MFEDARTVYQKTIHEIRDAGLYKSERIIVTPQAADIAVEGGKHVLNFCANNYLGLSSHPRVIEAAHKAIKLLANGTLKTYPGFSHGMLTVNADVLNADLLAFIKG